MGNLIDLIRQQTDQAGRATAQPRMAIIVSSDPNTYMARALLQPEDVLTGWLPVLTPWMGSGWGLACLPSPGDQVVVIPQEGSPDHGLIIGSLFSNLARPPRVELGEIALCHKSGSSIRLLNSGIVMISGDLHVSGDIYDAQGALGKLRRDYNAHTHQTIGGAITSVPSPVD